MQNPGERKKKGAKRSRGAAAGPWGSTDGWKVVDVADELLLGAEEGGFGGLEILDDVSLIEADLAALNAAASQQAAGDAAPASGKPTKKQKKQQQQQQQAAPGAGSKRRHAVAAAGGAAGGSEEGVAALKARLAALEAENSALKKQKKGEKQQKQTKQQQQLQLQGEEAAAGAEAATAAAAIGAAGDAGAAAAPAADGLSRKQRRQLQRQQKAAERRRRRQEAAQQAKAAKQQAKAAAGSSQAQQQQQQQSEAVIDMSAWSRFFLHPQLEAALAARGFSSPTPIQDAVLLPAIRDRRDVIGAAQTGSGKTLAFGLPILQVLLQEREQQLQLAAAAAPGQQTAAASAGAADSDEEGDEESDDDDDDEAAAAAEGTAVAKGGAARAGKGPLRALILAPTRELALQVAEHLQALGKPLQIRVVGLVGGIAPVKQARLLRSAPPVVVATPGRLWDLMRHGQGHLCQLEQLSFFVLDEADRMVQQGHYQELSSILDMLPTAARAAAVARAAAAEAREQTMQQRKADEQRSKQQQQQRAAPDEEDSGDEDEGGSQAEQEAAAAGSDNDDDSDQDQQQQQEGEEGEEDEREEDEKEQGGRAAGTRRHLLQTFVFSATLALPERMHKRLRRGGGGSSGAASLDSLMNRLHFRPNPAIIDLSPSSRLADRVVEGLLRCLDEERDAALYYLLARHPGKALVFVNAVSAVRRVAALLQLLGLPAYALHAQQQQRQRLKALDRFKAHPHGVLVATDVAARGLDIPDVQMVVHYQLPASADTFIHRSGRTARTGGSDGVVLSLVTPGDASRWVVLRRSLEGQQDPPAFPVDDRVLAAAHQRVALAAKIDAIQRKDRKQHAASSWTKVNAEALGIELSDASGDEGVADLQHTAVAAAAAGLAQGAKAKRGRKAAAAAVAAAAASADSQGQAARLQAAGQLAGQLTQLQRQLAAVLSVPLQPSISHKFFTGGLSRAAAAAVATAGDAQAAATAGEGEADGTGGTVNKPISLLPADAIAQTIQLAARLRHSRAGEVTAAGGTGADLSASKAAAAAAAAQERAAAKARRKAAAAAAAAATMGVRGMMKKAKRKGGPAAAGSLQQQGLARLLMSRNELKRQKRAGGGMVVVRPGQAAVGVFGRDTTGVSALEVLGMSGRK